MLPFLLLSSSPSKAPSHSAVSSFVLRVSIQGSSGAMDKNGGMKPSVPLGFRNLGRGRDKSWNEPVSFSWRARVSFPGNVEVSWERVQVAEPLELSQKKSNMLKGSSGGPVSVGKHTSKFDVLPCQPALAVSHSFSRSSNTAVLSCRVANNSWARCLSMKKC